MASRARGAARPALRIALSAAWLASAAAEPRASAPRQVATLDEALAAKRDVWGDAALARPEGAELRFLRAPAAAAALRERGLSRSSDRAVRSRRRSEGAHRRRRIGNFAEVRSPVEGVLFTLREYPLVYEGSLLARIMETQR